MVLTGSRVMPTVMIVDDHSDTAKVVSAFLTRAGYRAIPVNDVSSALEAVGETKPDVIITDLMMPYQSGLDLLHDVRNDPRTRDLPVIVYSAVSEQRYIDEAMNAGATDFWLKGALTAADLRTRLAAYLPPQGWAESVDAHQRLQN